MPAHRGSAKLKHEADVFGGRWTPGKFHFGLFSRLVLWFDTGINLILEQLSHRLVPWSLAPEENVTAWLDSGIVIKCAECDDRSFRCIEPFNE